MHRTAIVVAIVLTLSTMAFSGQGSQKSDGDNIRVVSVGEITKIDAETGSFELKSRVPEATSTGGRLGGWRGEVHVGISIGGGARRPETRGPTDPPWLPIPDALPRPARSARYTTTKVSTTEQTVFMQDGKKIAFDVLKVGNRVTVTGIPQGEDVEATEIKRQRPVLN